MVSKFFGAVVVAGALLIPSLSLAQVAGTSNGLLNVYVQVINQDYASYSPSNFTVAVSGTNPQPQSFQGSQSGTLVSITPGSYSVAVTNQYNFSPSYSVGCNNTISAGQTQTCVITMSVNSNYGYNNYSVYPYAYQTPALTCHTDTPTVALGQQARFTALGGAGGTYNWTTPNRNFPNVGPVLTTSFEGSGSQIVTVTNAAQSATCAVTVTTSYYPQPVSTPYYPTYSNTTYPNTIYSNGTYPTYSYPTYTQPTLNVGYVNPRFPNTGFAPISSAQMVFALVLVMGAGIIVFPYARKAFAIAVR